MIHLFHKWSEWETTREGEIKHRGTNSVVGYMIVQRRKCLVCKKIETNTQREYI